MIVTPEMLLAEALTWLETPYAHQASLKGVGADCIGIITGVAVAYALPDAQAFRDDRAFKGYGRVPDPALVEEASDRYLDRIDIADAGLMNILRFRIEDQPRHFAFISNIEPKRIIHAYAMHNANLSRVVEHGLGEWWQARVDRAYRLRGVTA